MTIVNQAPGSVRSSRSAVLPGPEWKNEQLMVVAGVEFFVTTDLADRPKMKSILDEEFPDRNIDLVIDDASHVYQETRSSFNSIFPYLKPGGIYIVEDWGVGPLAGRHVAEESSHPCMEAGAQQSFVRDLRVKRLVFGSGRRGEG